MTSIFGADIVVEPANDDKLGEVAFKAELRSDKMKWDFIFTLRKVMELNRSLYKQYSELPRLRESNEPILSTTRRRHRGNDQGQADKPNEKDIIEHNAEMRKEWKMERADDIEEWLSKLICSFTQDKPILGLQEVRMFLKIPDELYPEIELSTSPRDEDLKVVLEDRVQVRIKDRSKKRATVERTLKLYSDGTLRSFTLGGKPYPTGALPVASPKQNVSHGSHKHNFCVKSGRREWTISPTKISVENWITELSKMECKTQDRKEDIERLQKELTELKKNIKWNEEDERRIKGEFDRRKKVMEKVKDDIYQKYNNPRDGIPSLQYDIDKIIAATEELHNQIESVINEEGNAFDLLAITSTAKEKEPEPWQNWLKIGSVAQDKKYLKKPTEGEFYQMSTEMQKKFAALSFKQKRKKVYCHYHYTKNLHKHLHHHVADNCRTYHHSYSHTWILTEDPRPAWGYKKCIDESLLTPGKNAAGGRTSM